MAVTTHHHSLFYPKEIIYSYIFIFFSAVLVNFINIRALIRHMICSIFPHHDVSRCRATKLLQCCPREDII